MKFVFIAVGRNHESYVREGVEDFTVRISKYFSCEWKIIPPLKNSDSLRDDELKTKEAAQIIKNFSKDDYIIALDEKGTMVTSNKLASMLSEVLNRGAKRIVFIIGGAYGLDKEVISKSHFTWSLSGLTFPHQLVRMILSEQVYRACTIMRNEKYHHG